MENTTPRLSILMPVRNMEKYLAGTLDTVLAQTYQDWEMVIMDGASTDKTIKIATKYAEKDQRFRLCTEPDESPYQAVHKALNLARGKFVAVLCASDGYLNNSWLEEAMTKLIADPELSLVWGIPYEMSDGGQVIGPHFMYAHFLKKDGLGERPSIFKKVFQYIDLRHPSTLLTFLKKINPANLRTVRNLYERKEPPSKQEWFSYWLKTGSIFPDGNMCLTRRAMLDCLPPYKVGTREPGDWMGYYFNFNAKGYLATGIPIPANFGRLHGGQVSEKVQDYNNDNRRTYFKNLSDFKKKLEKDKSIFKFIDQEGQPLIKDKQIFSI